MRSRDRFLLEQMLMDCWHVTDDIDTISEYIGENVNIPANERDKMMNILIGMRDLYHLKYENTMKLFGELIKKGDIT